MKTFPNPNAEVENWYVHEELSLILDANDRQVASFKSARDCSLAEDRYRARWVLSVLRSHASLVEALRTAALHVSRTDSPEDFAEVQNALSAVEFAE